MKTLLVLCSALMLAGCAKDIKLGAGTIKDVQPNMTYLQDDGKLFSDGRSLLYWDARMNGLHCDSLILHTDDNDYIRAVDGTNCKFSLSHLEYWNK